MPDFEYRQAVATLKVGAPEAEFRAAGRIPLRQGWKAVYGATEPDVGDEAEQTLPPLTDGEEATLTEPRVEAKRTQPPPRYNEGTLIDAMQNAWRFVEAPAMRERLKEAKGIGTPATRGEIIKGLKRQNLLGADGKLVVPTEAGLQLFELLKAAAPALVDPGTTAEWEMQLDAVVTGQADFRTVIDGIAAAGQTIRLACGGHASGSRRSPDEIHLAMVVEKASAGLEIAVITGRQGHVPGLGELLGIGDHADRGHRAFGRGGRARLGIGGLAFRNPFHFGGRAPRGCFDAGVAMSRTKRPAQSAPSALIFRVRRLQAHRVARSSPENRDQLVRSERHAGGPFTGSGQSMALRQLAALTRSMNWT